MIIGFLTIGIILFVYICVFALLKVASDYDDLAEELYKKRNK